MVILGPRAVNASKKICEESKITGPLKMTLLKFVASLIIVAVPSISRSVFSVEKNTCVGFGNSKIISGVGGYI